MNIETLTQPTVAAIYKAYEDGANEAPRPHLGASIIGHECTRYLWYTFRWAFGKTFAGRMYRLFQTGNREEERIIANLRQIGVTVHATDENGKQIQVKHSNHVAGSIDGIAKGFDHYGKNVWHVLEFKTHNDASFKQLVNNGVRKHKPMHYAQMQVYMHLIGKDRALYIAVNKNTDEMYEERIKLDTVFAQQMLNRADQVIDSQYPPPRISDNPAYFACKFCDAYAVCHQNAMPKFSCRTCLHSTPDAEGWSCEHHKITSMDTQLQRQGCFHHKVIPALLPGHKVIDAGPDHVEYEAPNGKRWKNGPNDTTSKEILN